MSFSAFLLGLRRGSSLPPNGPGRTGGQPEQAWNVPLADAALQGNAPASQVYTMARCIIAGVIVTYLLAVLQTTLGGLFAIRGVSPDLLLVWTICLGLLSGRTAGALIGFACGLLEGGLTQKWIGAFAISKALSGCGAGVLATKLFRENWAVPAVSAALLTVLNEVTFLLVSRAGSWPDAVHRIALRMAYHAVLAPLMFALTLRVRRALVGRREEVA